MFRKYIKYLLTRWESLQIENYADMIFSAPEPKAQGELIVLDSSRRPCVRPCVHTFKHEYLRDQMTNHNQISSGASLGWGIDFIRFWVRSDQNSGFHGNK